MAIVSVGWHLTTHYVSNTLCVIVLVNTAMPIVLRDYTISCYDSNQSCSPFLSDTAHVLENYACLDKYQPARMRLKCNFHNCSLKYQTHFLKPLFKNKYKDVYSL